MIRIALLAGCMLLCICRLTAQSSSAQANVSVNIVTMLGTSVESEMKFGSFATNNQPGEIILTPQGERLSNGGIRLQDNADAGPAKYRVYGSNYDFTISIPGECLLVQKDGKGAMRMCYFDVSSTTDPLNGTGLISIGATLNINAQQLPGVYVPSAPIDIVINYN